MIEKLIIIAITIKKRVFTNMCNLGLSLMKSPITYNKPNEKKLILQYLQQSPYGGVE